MKLFLTPLSHFSRKVVIVLEELGVDYEREYVPDLLSDSPADFGGNPILRVPVLEDGAHWIVESDAIARYIADRANAADCFGFGSFGLEQRNALSFLAAIMGAEVEVILSRRAGQPAGRFTDRYPVVIERCLDWIESNGPRVFAPAGFSYLDITLICMWDHLIHSGLAPDPDRFAWIRERVASFGERPSVRGSSPLRMQELQWQLYPAPRPPV